MNDAHPETDWADVVSDTPRRTRSTKIFAACLLAALAAIVGGAIVACLVS